MHGGTYKSEAFAVGTGLGALGQVSTYNVER